MSEEAGFGAWEQDEDWRDFDDWYDEDSTYIKDEPDCHACYDSGWVYRFDREDKARVCRACHPTRFQMFRWRVAGWFDRVRYRRRWNNEEGPF